MAPERIDPPNPNKPDYDIRADVWSLGITLVELATGSFPYRDCHTDFEVLTKVLTDDPPLLPHNRGFSIEFCSFVRDCLMKNYRDRPKYKKLLVHPFIQRFEREEVDVGAWYRSHMKNLESNNPTSGGLNSTVSPNNNSGSASKSGQHHVPDSLNLAPTSSDKTFKPQPSPRVTRSWLRQTPQSPSGRRPSDPLSPLTSAGAEPTQSRRAADPNQPSPRSLGSSSTSYSGTTPTPTSAPSPYGSYEPVQAISGGAGNHRSRYHHHYPTNGGNEAHPASPSAAYSSTSALSSPYSTAPSRWAAVGRGPTTSTTAYGGPPAPSSGPRSLDEERDLRTARYATYVPPSPRSAAKFDFTYPSTLPPAAGSGEVAASQLLHQYRTGTASGRPPPPPPPHQMQREAAVASRRQHQKQHDSLQRSAYDAFSQTSPYLSSRMTSSEHSAAANSQRPHPQQQQPQQPHQRSPSQEGQSQQNSSSRGSYFPSWRNLSSWSFQSPISLRRLRTASTDRAASAFDAARRFQPGYRSWNERDDRSGGNYQRR